MIGDQAIYENELVASRDVKTGSLGSVTRDSIFRYYPGADVAGCHCVQCH